MAEVIMTVGLPGSGKTTWASSQDGYEVFSSDEIRRELGDVNDQTQNEKVFRILYERIKAALEEGKDCIYDATNLTAKNRRAFLSYINGTHCKKTARVFVRSFDTIREQNENRDRTVPPDVIKKMLYRWQTPIVQEGFDNIELDVVKCWADISDIKQDNPHHTLSLYDHMINTKNALPEDVDVSLRNAAMVHDIGKYWTKTFIDSKGYPTLEAHYYSHENVGAYMLLLSDGDLYGSGLITWHMRPFVWDAHPHVKEKDRQWMGDDYIRKLEILHKADLEAK